MSYEDCPSLNITHRPHQEAIALLRKYGSNARILAGGTDLLLAMKKRVPHRSISSTSKR